MNLRTKKTLAKGALKVGRERIVFLKSRMDEIKEAITKQDIRDLKQEGAILVKEVGGRRKNAKKKNKRSTGNIRKKVNVRKQEYVIMTRKLRKIVAGMKLRGEIDKAETKDIRNKIRNRVFKSAAHLKKYVVGLRK